jgi:hypothetical protein
MVSFCCDIFLLCSIAAMLPFFIAGLLFICASSTLITWERTPHSRPETGLLVSSDYNSYFPAKPLRFQHGSGGECIAMTQLSRRIGGICLAVLAVLIVAGYAGWRYAEWRSSVTLSQAKTRFERSINNALPLQSDKASAVLFLNSQKIRYVELSLQNG